MAYGRKGKHLLFVVILISLLGLIVLSATACTQKAQPGGNHEVTQDGTLQQSPSRQTIPTEKTSAQQSTGNKAASAVANGKDSFTFDVLGDSKILPGQENWRGNRVLTEAVERINQYNPALGLFGRWRR